MYLLTNSLGYKIVFFDAYSYILLVKIFYSDLFKCYITLNIICKIERSTHACTQRLGFIT